MFCSELSLGYDMVFYFKRHIQYFNNFFQANYTYWSLHCIADYYTYIQPEVLYSFLIVINLYILYIIPHISTLSQPDRVYQFVSYLAAHNSPHKLSQVFHIMLIGNISF